MTTMIGFITRGWSEKIPWTPDTVWRTLDHVQQTCIQYGQQDPAMPFAVGAGVGFLCLLWLAQHSVAVASPEPPSPCAPPSGLAAWAEYAWVQTLILRVTRASCWWDVHVTRPIVHALRHMGILASAPEPMYLTWPRVPLPPIDSGEVTRVKVPGSTNAESEIWVYSTLDGSNRRLAEMVSTCMCSRSATGVPVAEFEHSPLLLDLKCQLRDGSTHSFALSQLCTPNVSFWMVDTLVNIEFFDMFVRHLCDDYEIVDSWVRNIPSANDIEYLFVDIMYGNLSFSTARYVLCQPENQRIQGVVWARICPSDLDSSPHNEVEADSDE